MFCSKCGCKIRAGSTTCEQCGAKVNSIDLCGGFWGLVGEEPELIKENAEAGKKSEAIEQSSDGRKAMVGSSVDENRKQAINSKSRLVDSSAKTKSKEKWPLVILIVLCIEIVQFFTLFYMEGQIKSLKNNMAKITSQTQNDTTSQHDLKQIENDNKVKKESEQIGGESSSADGLETGENIEKKIQETEKISNSVNFDSESIFETGNSIGFTE